MLMVDAGWCCVMGGVMGECGWGHWVVLVVSVGWDAVFADGVVLLMWWCGGCCGWVIWLVDVCRWIGRWVR